MNAEILQARLDKLVKQVQKMRHYQDQYFRYRARSDLSKAKYYEREVDRLVAGEVKIQKKKKGVCLMMNDKAFIPIRRKLFQHFLFKERRTFSRFEAWLDLIQMASFTDEKMELVSGRLMQRDRGEVIASLRYLMTRWDWGKSKVGDFLELLRSQQMVVVDKTGGVTKIKLINWEEYNEKAGKKDTKRDSQRDDINEVIGDKGTQNGTATDPPKGQRGDREGTNIKKGNKGDKGKGDGALAPKYVPAEEDKERFNGFIEWIKVNAPNVARMKEPFTIQEFLQLRLKLNREVVQDLLKKMHNYQPLLKKNRSAYLTILNWSKNSYNQTENQNNGGQPSAINERLKATLAAAQQRPGS